jgi:uncharacterized alpha-E superfamily protein
VDAVERLFAELIAHLQHARIQEIINHGLHEFIDGFQASLNKIGAEIYRGFFEIQPRKQRQSQEQ